MSTDGYLADTGLSLWWILGGGGLILFAGLFLLLLIGRKGEDR